MSLLGVTRSFSVGAATVGEKAAIWRPKNQPPAGLPGMINVHGYGGGAEAYLDQAFGNIPGVVAQRGIVNYAGDFGGISTWGNNSAVSTIGEAVDYLAASLGAVGPIHMLGGSMGALNVLNYAKRFPADVASLTLIIPLVALDAFHDENRGGYATTVEAAYGGLAGYNADIANRDPSQWTSEVPDVPTRIYYSTNDPLCLPAEVLAFATAIGAEPISLGAVGHVAQGLIDPNAIADFCWAA
jgi:pimeloyl-ACP methyl ester carboxylesterase